MLNGKEELGGLFQLPPVQHRTVLSVSLPLVTSSLWEEHPEHADKHKSSAAIHPEPERKQVDRAIEYMKEVRLLTSWALPSLAHPFE